MKTIALRGRRGAGLFALVDDDDFERINAYRWYALHVKGSLTVYARTVIDGETIYMHHMVKPKFDEMEIDHDDRSGLNNQSHNLRYLTHAENIKNSAAGDRAWANRGERAKIILATREMRDESAHVHKITSRGRAYYYHRHTRVRLPDDPLSDEFKTALVRLNKER